MGLNLCWIGVEQGQQSALLDRLGFEAIGEAGDEIGVDYACAALPNGWLVFVATDRLFDLDGVLDKVSADGVVLGCEMSETVMVSRARAFQDASLLWSVRRDPDKDRYGVLVEGVPPPQFDEIRQRLQAGQSALDPETIDLMFDLPVQLAASVCGYRAGQTRGIASTVLQKKSPGSGVASSRPAQSLSAAMRRELLPLLQGLGWTLTHDPPSLSDPGEIVRWIDNQKQTIWFDFGSGKESYIIVHFNSWDGTSPRSGYAISGHTRDAPVRLPLWRRFTLQTLWALTQPEATAGDATVAVIRKAKDEILAVDAFLKSGELAPCVYVGFAGPVEQNRADVQRPSGT